MLVASIVPHNLRGQARLDDLPFGKNCRFTPDFPRARILLKDLRAGEPKAGRSAAELMALWARHIVGRVYDDRNPITRSINLGYESPSRRKGDAIYFRRMEDMTAGIDGGVIRDRSPLPYRTLENLRTIRKHPVVQVWEFVVAELDAKKVPVGPINQRLKDVIAVLDRQPT